MSGFRDNYRFTPDSTPVLSFLGLASVSWVTVHPLSRGDCLQSIVHALVYSGIIGQRSFSNLQVALSALHIVRIFRIISNALISVFFCSRFRLSWLLFSRKILLFLTRLDKLFLFLLEARLRLGGRVGLVSVSSEAF